MKMDVEKFGRDAMAQMMPGITAGMEFLASKIRAASPRSKRPKKRGHMADNIRLFFRQNKTETITAIIQVPFPARFLEHGARWPAKPVKNWPAHWNAKTGRNDIWHTKPHWFIRETMIRSWNQFVSIVKS